MLTTALAQNMCIRPEARPASEAFRKEVLGLDLEELGDAVDQTADTVSRARRAAHIYTSGESVLNDFLVNLQNNTPLKGLRLGNLLRKGRALALKAGLGLAGPIGLVALAGFLGTQGSKELAEGVRNKDADIALDGTRSLLLGAETAGLAAGMAATLPHAAFRVAGQVAKTAAVPLGIAHIGVDIAQGTTQTVKGVRGKDKHATINGLATLGTGIAWGAGMVAGPLVGLSIAGVMAGVKFFNNRRARKKAQAAVFNSL